MSLSVSQRQNDISFLQDGRHKCRIFQGKPEFIQALAPKSRQEKESNMKLRKG